MRCPYPDCDYEGKFEHIKTHKEKTSVLRGWKCPKCGRSFVERGKLIPEPYYQREHNANRSISQSTNNQE